MQWCTKKQSKHLNPLSKQWVSVTLHYSKGGSSRTWIEEEEEEKGKLAEKSKGWKMEEEEEEEREVAGKKSNGWEREEEEVE